MLDLNNCITLLKQQAQAIHHLLADVSAAQARWKPDAASWSILEVLNHLYDEEREDFRLKLKHLLDKLPGLPPENDPQGWVTQRHYNQRDLDTSLAQFLQERENSLRWLQSLTAPDWDAALVFDMGKLSAGDLLASWVAHDLLHQRQLVELRYLYLLHQFQPYGVGYAGDW
ncbi:MAG: DinB family protein [Anaerolineae bacterium]